MDIVSITFATYLNMLNEGFTKGFLKTLGWERQTQVIVYQGYNIDFTFQRFKIDGRSVCLGYKDDILEQSKCTKAAKKMFADACTELKNTKSLSAMKDRYQTMFCTAAATYQPIIATISKSKKRSEVAKAKEDCNKAIVNAMDDTSKIRYRDHVCNQYKQLSQQMRDN